MNDELLEKIKKVCEHSKGEKVLICITCNYQFIRDTTRKILENIHNQPERSKREDSHSCEMRCSEHCGNTMREAK